MLTWPCSLPRTPCSSAPRCTLHFAGAAVLSGSSRSSPNKGIPLLIFNFGSAMVPGRSVRIARALASTTSISGITFTSGGRQPRSFVLRRCIAIEFPVTLSFMPMGTWGSARGGGIWRPCTSPSTYAVLVRHHLRKRYRDQHQFGIALRPPRGTLLEMLLGNSFGHP